MIKRLSLLIISFKTSRQNIFVFSKQLPYALHNCRRLHMIVRKRPERSGKIKIRTTPPRRDCQIQTTHLSMLHESHERRNSWNLVYYWFDPLHILFQNIYCSPQCNVCDISYVQWYVKYCSGVYLPIF